jgi:FAD/FMN-containing dehydrogenase
LGGGVGYLVRKYGLTIDDLLAAEVVTADGEVLRLESNSHPDLFWAIRGGGGNCGVVTRFTFRLHEVGPMITGGLMFWGADRAADVFEAYQTVANSAPRELMTGFIVTTAPPAPFIPEEFHGKRGIGVLVCHSGRNPETDIEPLRKVGHPVADLVAPRPYVEQQQLLDDMEPKGFNQYWKTEYLPGLSPEYLETTLETGLTAASPHSYTITLQLGGAITDRATDDGAVGNRDAEFIAGVAAMWEDDGRDAEHVAWARDGWNRFKQFSTGGNYVNFQMPDDNSTRTAAAYGSNIQRLEGIKAAYDPDNFFRVNRNVSPVSPA